MLVVGLKEFGSCSCLGFFKDGVGYILARYGVLGFVDLASRAEGGAAKTLSSQTLRGPGWDAASTNRISRHCCCLMLRRPCCTTLGLTIVVLSILYVRPRTLNHKPHRRILQSGPGVKALYRGLNSITRIRMVRVLGRYDSIVILRHP